MVNVNKVFLAGRLTRDPDVRYLPSGTAVAQMRLAVNRRFKDKTGQRQEEACFINIVAWDKQAQVCKEYLQKGSPIFVDGRVQSRSYTDKEGKSRNVIEVRATHIDFLSTETQRPKQVDLGPEPKDTIINLEEQ